MGIYLNPDNTDFQYSLNAEIYVDKTELIAYTNRMINTENRFICVSRPRRFGKSMAANMLTAYYSSGCDSASMFQQYKIAKERSFRKHLNRYNVIHINMANFMSRGKNAERILDYLSKRLLHEIKKENSDVECFDWNDLCSVLDEVFAAKKIPFIFIIDEWDCVFREMKEDPEAQKLYLEFLRGLLKDQSYVALAYLTGILPIKKYGKHSALNMFTEISMTDASPIPEFTGFTDEEVCDLCERYQVSYEMMRSWYDGYRVNGVSIYNPKSAVEAITRKNVGNYWTSTETYEALKVYICMDFDGLKEKVTRMIAGESVVINPTKFQNDMTTFSNADDVLTLLVHLGYLSFDHDTSAVHIPNSEVQQEFINSIEDGGWEFIMDAIKASDRLLEATLNGDEGDVAEKIEKAHSENASILKYNDENALACVISIAYYSARKQYIMHRELATGKGFADIVFLPRKNADLPAIVVELKRNQSADTAISQIKARKYTEKIAEYTGEILLVGISYDEQKGHSCTIERVMK